MNTRSPFLFVASMDIDPEHEDLFNEVYDREHVPSLSRVPGVRDIARFERVELTMSIGGELRRMESAAPRYHALYEIDAPEVLTGHGNRSYPRRSQKWKCVPMPRYCTLSL